MVKIISVSAVAAVAMLGLSACGSSPGDRAVSGAGIGAAAGAAGGALTGGSPVAGALIGGAGGAAVGGLTDSHDFDLGKPVWKR
jgi:osmotically inducible lipoprotein OsmB